MARIAKMPVVTGPGCPISFLEQPGFRQWKLTEPEAGRAAA